MAVYSSFFIFVSVLFTAAMAATTCPVIGSGGIYTYNDSTTTGPSNWGNIATFQTCGSGTAQSPINIQTPSGISVSLRPTHLYPTSNMNLKASTENWSFECPTSNGCGYTLVNTVLYNVANIHFHTQSEHHIDGVSYPLELHIVHVGPAGDFVVLATMFQVSETATPNALVTAAFDAICNGDTSASLPLSAILGLTSGVLSYSGSLTTPPCSETVTFYMQKKVQTVTAAQIAQYVKTIGSPIDANNRPLQAINGRTVTSHI